VAEPEAWYLIAHSSWVPRVSVLQTLVSLETLGFFWGTQLAAGAWNEEVYTP
jgi:hypothetical protein